MPTTVKVYPTKKTAVGLKHPHGPALLIAGSLWPQDSFTARRLTDGSVTKDASKVYVPAAPAPSPATTAPTSSAPAASEQASTAASAPAPVAEPTAPAASNAAPKTA